MNPFFAIALVLATLGSLIGIVALLNHFQHWPAELTRKAIHIGMGLVCLSFPLLFHESWPVLLLAVLAAAGLTSIRYLPALQTRVGHILGAVSRTSWGEIYFPIAIAAVFVWHENNPLLFLIPVLQLTVSDSVGALIGLRYGIHRYTTDDGQKSAEGSLAFLLAAFLATFIPLQLYGLFWWGNGAELFRQNPFQFQISVAISLLLALILTLMEAISWRGLDNLFIPLTCQVLLRKTLPLDSYILLRELLILLAIIALIAVWRRRTHLSRSAGIGAGLVLYASWLLGGWQWLLGPVATLAGYSLLCFRTQEIQTRHHLVHAVFAVAAPGLFWLYLANTMRQPEFIYPYGLAYAANFGMICAAFFLQKSTRSLLRGILYSAALAFLLHAAPYLIVWQRNSNRIDLTLAAAGLLLFAVAIFVCWQTQIRQCPADAARWCRQGTLAAVTSLTGSLIILYFQWILPIS